MDVDSLKMCLEKQLKIRADPEIVPLGGVHYR
jgi:hypothetical protein